MATAHSHPPLFATPTPLPWRRTHPRTPIVEARGLWTVFGKGTEAFAVHQDLEFVVQRGEMLSLVGGSGTGKTVLLRQILGLAQPTRGTVTVLGRPASEMGREGRCQPRGHAVPARRVVLGLQRARQRGLCPARARHPARRAGARRRPGQAADGGPQAQARHPHARRSVGRHGQRVALARALIIGPPCLLLDEAHCGLDPTQLRRLLCPGARGLRLLPWGSAVIMVTHDLDTCCPERRVAVLADKKSSSPAHHFWWPLQTPRSSNAVMGRRRPAYMAPCSHHHP